jgi:hypothetical protein
MFLQEMIPNRNIFYFYFVFLPQFYGEKDLFSKIVLRRLLLRQCRF